MDILTTMTLCMSMFMNKDIDKDAAIRGCALSGAIVSASEAHDKDPFLIAAIAWQESNFFTNMVGGSGECGAMQVLPQYSSFTCKQMKQGQGIEAGVQALDGWLKYAGNLRGALERYNCGYRDLPRCRAYRRNVIRKANSLKSTILPFEINV